MVLLSDLLVRPERSFYYAVPITTVPPEPPSPFAFQLPWHPAGKVCTGLKQRASLLLDCPLEIHPDAIVKSHGQIKKEMLLDLYTRLETYEDQHAPPTDK